jgi:hypothetical protein
MQIAAPAIQPPVTILPVDPPATKAPSDSPTRPLPITPAQDLLLRYGSHLESLGVARMDYVDPTTVSLVYFNNFAGVQAAGALKDVVDGVRLLVENRSLTADYWQATGDNVARWLEQSSSVDRVQRRETSPMHLTVFGRDSGSEVALHDLLRPQLEDGTTIDVPVRMWIQ